MMFSRSTGFTLVEMMIALLVAAIIVTPFYLVTSGVSERAVHQQMETEAAQRARIGLNSLITDLNKAGHLASPHPNVDPRSLCREIPGSSALHRRAVVHLNRADTSMGFDSILITGNFLGIRSYAAIASNNVFSIPPTEIGNERECLLQFSPDYAFAHIVIPSGLHFDAQVTDAQFNAGTCQITVRGADMPLNGLADGDQVFVAANQTVRYAVESIDEPMDPKGNTTVRRYDLVKYYGRYTAASTNQNCSFAQVTSTRQVVAKYVVDFQVWFRPILNNTTTQNTVPNYDGLTDLGTTTEFTSDKIGAIPGQNHLIPASGVAVSSADLSCDTINTYGPEHVRSAVVRLAVRSERTDRFMDYRNFDDDMDPKDGLSRLARYAVRPYNTEVSSLPDRPGALYKIQTVVTEVAMPNLAARSDIIFQ